ncbi:hypothetical protein Bca4012_099699 [Brassica carinata]
MVHEESSFNSKETSIQAPRTRSNIQENGGEDQQRILQYWDIAHFHRGFLVSPVSHLDPFWTRVSPHSAREYPHASPNDVEQKVIAEKGFYVLLSPRSGAEQAPKLLPLFPLPLRSPNATNQWTEEDYRKS